MRHRAVFLDRDGVLNQSLVREGKPFAPRTMSEFHLYPETLDGITLLRKAGFLLVVATNQPDIGNGLTDVADVAAMHAHISEKLGIEHISMCPHSQDAGCACRKPRPGMLLDAAERLGIDLAASFMIGDRAGDIAAGKAAGCRTIHIDRHYHADKRPDAPDRTVGSFTEAVAAILEQGVVHAH